MQTDHRIAIIGGGAAGISAAHYLRRRGYRRVTIFEKRSRLGGKCHTVRLGGRSHELGALAVGVPYANVSALIREAGLATGPLGPAHLVALTSPPRAKALGWPVYRTFLRPLLKLSAVCLRHWRRLTRPGYAGLAGTDLARFTFARYLHSRRLEAVRDLVAPNYVGWGYGHLERVPALYVFKLMQMYLAALGRMLSQPGRPLAMAHLPGGYQCLFEAVARPFERLTAISVEAIERGDRVAVHWNGQRREFDRLILACPLQDTPRFLDAGPEERRLFGAIRTLAFVSLTAEVDGLPPYRLAFVPGHTVPYRSGRVVSWYRRWPDAALGTFYALADGVPDDRVIADLARDLVRIGARLKRVLHLDRWRYFPHVRPREAAGGFYDRLEALQGYRRTWYAGELLSFPTVEHVVAYSRALVGRHF
jgi:phytoene dehydrogenase-like protein